MDIETLKPFSPNWNLLKHEFVRDLEIFGILKNATKDKDTIKLLNSIIANCKESKNAMDAIEKTPDVFSNIPFVEPDESIEE